jgi:prepilin-type N-terminal cleavage/methylation domain-containing protein
MSLNPGGPTPIGKARSIAARAGERGFTLLEIAIVVFIMGLLVTLITPRLSGLRTARLKSEVRRLSGRASYLYDKATSNKLVMRLTFDLDTNRYFVSRLDPYALEPMFIPDLDPGSAPVMLPAGVRVRDVAVEGVGALDSGVISSTFYPQGYVDMTVIHIQDEAGHVFTIKLDPITGRPIVRKGDIPVAAAAAMLH